MASSEWTLKRFGRPTRAIQNPLTDTVGTTPTLILHNNPDRFMWLVVNLSPNNVYLAFDPKVSSTRGILLTPSGGWVSMVIEDDGEAVVYEVWAVASAAPSAIYVVEMEAI